MPSHGSSLTETQKAYLAGYLDGDGYVGMTFLKGKNHYGEIRIEVNISSTSKKTIKEIREIVGYGIIDEKKRSKKDKIKHPTWRNYYIWRINTQKEIYDFISQILPYSKTRKKQLKLLKEYIESRMTHPKIMDEYIKNGRIYKIPHKAPYTNREKEIVLEVQRLNRGGG